MADAFVLDSYAILAFLGGEEGAETVAGILASPENAVFISAVSLGEVYVALLRRRGVKAADQTEEVVYGHPRLRVVEATRERLRAAAGLRADANLSLADAGAAALALETRAVLVTGNLAYGPLETKGLRLRWLVQAKETVGPGNEKARINR